ncbi:hypothetical protein OF83DRAFT_667522 [Amylostereum chailletii]|nr:hypothetical protein OF83DRAFT_667522 [Amylostereum chailletii]
MCHYRRVKNIFSCGHAVDLKDELIPCNSADCKFSPFHPPACRPPACTSTCWQYRQAPEQYAPRLATPCPMCKGRR